MRRLLILAIVAAVHLPVGAQTTGERRAPDSSSKQAWEWTIEERIAARTDSELARKRVSEGRQEPGSMQPVNRIDGATHPELFLPHEVFEALIGFTFPRGVWSRETCHWQLTRKGKFPEDSCERLQSASAVYAADFWAWEDLRSGIGQLRGGARQRAEASLALKQADLCRSRAEALSAVRREFGRERFDRFLYEAIAVSMGSVTHIAWDRASLWQNELGCGGEPE